jgi:hypothetical protein
MLIVFTVVLMLALAYAFVREGLLTALSMTANVFLAGLVAFNFFEPLADTLDELMLEGSFLEGYADYLSLVLLFAVSLGVLRWATNNLATSEMDLPPLLQQGGALVCGLLAGYLLAGFLLSAMQTLPVPQNFMGFESTVQTPEKPVRRVLPPERVWLALMHRAGLGPLSWGTGPTFDHDGNFELRYNKLRRYKQEAPGPE